MVSLKFNRQMSLKLIKFNQAHEVIYLTHRRLYSTFACSIFAFIRIYRIQTSSSPKHLWNTSKQFECRARTGNWDRMFWSAGKRCGRINRLVGSNVGARVCAHILGSNARLEFKFESCAAHELTCDRSMRVSVRGCVRLLAAEMRFRA